MTELDHSGDAGVRQRNWFVAHWYWCVAGAAVVLALSLWLWLVHVSVHEGYIDEDRQEVVHLIEQFHARLNAKQFDQIYDDSSADLQKAQSREDFISATRKMQTRWGKFQQATASEANVLVGPQVQVRAAYNSTFEKGAATELFIFVRQGEALQLAFYNITEGTTKLDSNDEDLAIAKKAADEFYRHVSAKEYGAIWDAAHPAFKKSASREQLIGFFQQMDQKLGTCGAPTLVDTDYATFQGGEHAVGLTYHRICEHGDLRERMAWTIMDGKALLSNYH